MCFIGRIRMELELYQNARFHSGSLFVTRVQISEFVLILGGTHV